jgi:transposase
MDTTGQTSPAPLVQLLPPLDVRRVGEFEVVHVGATPIARYAVTDVTARRHVMVQLAEAGRLPGQEIAARFGVTPVYVSQLRGRYREAGSAELLARRRGPKGPSKVTPALDVRVHALRAQGLSYQAIAQAVAATQPISYQTVRRLLLREGAEQLDLPVEAAPATAGPLVAPVAPVESTGPRPAAIPQGPTRYAGAMLLHVALSQLGLWSVFHTAGASVGRSVCSVAQVVGVVALGFALRLRSIEGFKTALRRDFGRLLGLPVAPAVQTLRTRVRALAESLDPALVMRHLVEAFVHLEPVWEGAYYIDGHFCPYSGSQPVPKAWNAKRRLVEPGQTDLYVHDATGRVLFFINRPMNDQLMKAVPEVLAEVRRIAPPQGRILLVFDRGGYSGPLFKMLTAEGVGFLTYLKGRAARRRFPADRFERRWWEIVDPAGIQPPRRVVYRIYEKRTRLRGVGQLRTLVVLDDEAHQIPVLTNCDDLSPAKAVHLLKLRWRQENSFKYLSEHYGIEQLLQYDATSHADDRLVENPRRVQVRHMIADLQAEVVFKEAELGRLVETPRAASVRVRQRELRALEDRLARLEQRLATTPAKVPAATVTGEATRATMNTDRRNLVNAIKIATYNAERWLGQRFFQHYHDPRDWLTIFRSILQLPGVISVDADGAVQVTLQAPDRPNVHRALAGLLEDLNRLDGRLFGNGPALTFQVAS